MADVPVRLVYEDGSIAEDVLLSRLPIVGEEIDVWQTKQVFRVLAVRHNAAPDDTAREHLAGTLRVEEIEPDW